MCAVNWINEFDLDVKGVGPRDVKNQFFRGKSFGSITGELLPLITVTLLVTLLVTKSCDQEGLSLRVLWISVGW